MVNSPPSQPVFRFAPSPNGYLHLGHAWSALFAFGMAAREGGVCLLRIEDVDPGRSRAEFDAAIREDLHWLGLSWPEPVMRQSDRFPAYREAGERLRGMGLLYPCFCTRTAVAEAAEGTDPEGAPLYPGTCRHLPAGEATARLARGDPVQYRLDVEAAAARTGVLSFTVVGASPGDRPMIRIANPRRWGDVVLQRKGLPTSYHLSVVVDDAAQGVTHVTRGTDMEAATDIHVLLQMLLGLPTPLYTFHRLVLGPDGRKLSKSRNSPSLRDLRAAGWTPEQVRAELGFA
jgi:glutamyl-Q tRNA(Asp) synthetase